MSRTGLWVRIGIAALVLLAVSCGGEEAASAPSPAAVEPSPAPVLPTTEPPAPTVALSPSPTPSPASSPSPSPALTASATPPDTIMVNAGEHTVLGTILVDGSGRTLYLFSEDERNQSNCAGSCAEAWPPLLTVRDASAGEGVTVDALGSITRDDGSNQVTYNGWPLYYFAGDETPGDAEGQNSGGVWFVVSVYGGPTQDNATVTTSEHPQLGTILTDASGRTLYLFTVDERDKSDCLGGCALAWPPLLTVGDPTADEGIAGERLSSVTRDDGSVQVTYNGWPLYYFAPDRGPGDARGQNSGDLWYVVSTYGGPIQTNTMVKSSDHPELGTILTEASGRTVYLFTIDERSKSTCSRGCALAWPPLLTVGDPEAEEGVANERLGSIEREDGYTQVTYREGFAASFTDKGISETSLSLPALLGQPPIALRRVMDPTTSGDTTTIHAMFALGTQRNSVRYSMAKQGGVWKIDGEERLSPKIQGDTMVVDVRLDGCASMFDSETITGRNVALRVENVGEEHHHLILKSVPEGLDLGRLLQGGEPPSQGVDEVAFVGAPGAGELINVAFTEALQPGRYVLLCYPLDPKGDEGVQLLAEGIVAAFTVR